VCSKRIVPLGALLSTFLGYCSSLDSLGVIAKLPVLLQVAVSTQRHQIPKRIIPLLAAFCLMVNLKAFQPPRPRTSIKARRSRRSYKASKRRRSGS
jgi:hypothetical protein